MATSTTFNITTGVTSFTCTFPATDAATVKCFIVSTGAEIDANDYTISGRSASSTSSYIVIDWPDAGDYVGEQLIVRKYVDIDTGAPADAMLSDFTTVSQASREVLQNEFAHLYGIVGDITGGDAVGTYDLGDIGTLITRLNDLADDIFTTTTNSGTPAVWDGTNTLSIGGDTNVQSILTTHETRLDAAEPTITTHTAQIAGTTSSGLKTAIDALSSQVTSQAGLPTLVASGQAEVADSASTLQILAVDQTGLAVEWIDLNAQVGPAPITDTGNYYTTDTVNAALQQIGPAVASVGSLVRWIAASDVNTLGNIEQTGNLSDNFKRTGNVKNYATWTDKPTNAAVELDVTGEYLIYVPTSFVIQDCDLIIHPMKAGYCWFIKNIEQPHAGSDWAWRVAFDQVDQSVVGPPSVNSVDTELSFTILYMKG